MNVFAQRKTLTDLENNYAYLKGKVGGMDKLRWALPYVYKYTLYTYIKKTDHVAREVYGTLCDISHGKRIRTWTDVYNVQMNQIVYT